MAMDDARSVSAVVGIGTSYNIDKKVEIDLNYRPKTARFVAEVSLITIHFENMSTETKPQKVNLCISRDSGGNKYVLTETESDIQEGIGDDTKGSAMFKVEGIVSLPVADTVFAHLKLNQGSADCSEIVITWRDERK
tara:strand:+ start:4667 stop:5077 length:411 start_codon:yes stop_codon:yes gene_type:complete